MTFTTVDERERDRERGGGGPNLALDQLLGNLDGGLTEGSSVLCTDFSTH